VRRGAARGRRAGAALVIAGALCAGGAAGGCSSLLGIDSDRYVVDAGDDMGGEAAPEEAMALDGSDAPDAPDATVEPAGFACLNDPLPTPAPGNVEIELLVEDVSSASAADSYAGAPVVGATATACSTLDLICAHPLATATTDDGGIATMSLQSGFDGYYQVQATGYPPGVLARPPLLQSEQVQVGLISSTLLSLAPTLVGVNQDPNKTIAIATVYNCVRSTATGMTFAIGAPGPDEQLFYFQSSLPTAAATSTDSTGSAIIFNVPPGTISLTATLPGSTQTLRAVNAMTRVGWVLFVTIRPDQAAVTPP
jgi:hypothetical protein